MANIKGKYQIVENKNYYELLVKIGLPEERAKAVNDAKSIYEIEVDGNKIRITSDSHGEKNVSELLLNEEVEEKFPTGLIAKSTTTLNGNTLTINSINSEGTMKREYKFSATGAEEVLIINKGDITAEATHIFKRL